MLFKILSCYCIMLLALPIHATEQISYTTVSPSCHLYTTTEMHEKCGVYAYFRIKPLLIDMQTYLNQIKLLESVIEAKKNSISADDYKKAMQDAQNTINIKNDEISDLKAEKQIIEIHLKTKNDIIIEKDKQINSLNLAVSNAKTNYEAQIMLLNLQILNLNKAIEAKDKQISDLGNTIQDLQNTISTKDKGFADQQGDLGKLNSTIFTLGQTIEDKDKQLIENGKTIQQLQADILQKDNLISVLQSGQSQQNGKLVEKDKTIEEYKQQINNLHVDMNNKDNRIAGLQTTVNSYQGTLQSKDSQLSQAQSRVNTLQSELDQLKTRQCHHHGNHPFHPHPFPGHVPPHHFHQGPHPHPFPHHHHNHPHPHPHHHRYHN